MLLAGDIGGTKTRLALYEPKSGPRKPVVEKSFPSQRFPDLESIVHQFLGDVDRSVSSITHACFGVAGPVVGGKATITNLPWTMDEQVLRAEFELEAVRLLNDLESIAAAIPALEVNEVVRLNDGSAIAQAPIAVVAPGTGLGEAFLTWRAGGYHPHASEGGHADFAPTNRLQAELLLFLLEERKLPHVSYEMVCSGKGIPNLYDFLKSTGRADEPAWLTDKLADCADRVPVILATALAPADESCDLCRMTLDLFVAILGAEAGNLGLKVLATGGVYLGGGIPPRILPALQNERFMDAFLNKGRLAHVLKDVPVTVILNTDAALLGAASHVMTFV